MVWGGGDEYSYDVVSSSRLPSKFAIRGRISEERRELKRLSKVLPIDIIQSAEKELSDLYEKNETFDVDYPIELWGNMTRAIYAITNPLREMEKCMKIEHSLFCE
jgi:hypothetical protein